MTAARQHDSVRTTAVAVSLFDGRSVLPGAEGVVLEARADGTCLAELVLTPQTAGAGGDFVQVVLCDGQYEIIRAGGNAFTEQPYWIRHPGGPFTTLITVATTYLHPEADDLESLQELAERDDRPEMRAFKAELRQAITHPDQVPRDELSSHVQYDDGSPEAFLRRLWRDLYGDEPAGNPAAPETGKTDPDRRLAGERGCACLRRESPRVVRDDGFDLHRLSTFRNRAATVGAYSRRELVRSLV